MVPVNNPGLFLKITGTGIIITKKRPGPGSWSVTSYTVYLLTTRCDWAYEENDYDNVEDKNSSGKERIIKFLMQIIKFHDAMLQIPKSLILEQGTIKGITAAFGIEKKAL